MLHSLILLITIGFISESISLQMRAPIVNSIQHRHCFRLRFHNFVRLLASEQNLDEGFINVEKNEIDATKPSAKGFGIKSVKSQDSESIGSGKRSAAKQKYQELLKIAKKQPSLKRIIGSKTDSAGESMENRNVKFRGR